MVTRLESEWTMRTAMVQDSLEATIENFRFKIVQSLAYALEKVFPKPSMLVMQMGDTISVRVRDRSLLKENTPFEIIISLDLNYKEDSVSLWFAGDFQWAKPGPLNQDFNPKTSTHATIAAKLAEQGAKKLNQLFGFVP